MFENLLIGYMDEKEKMSLCDFCKRKKKCKQKPKDSKHYKFVVEACHEWERSDE